MDRNYVLEVNNNFKIRKNDVVTITRNDLEILEGIVIAILEQGILIRETFSVTAMYIEYSNIAVLNDIVCDSSSFILKEGE